MVTRATPIEEQELNESSSNTLKKEEDPEQKIREDVEMRETLCDYVLDDFPSRYVVVIYSVRRLIFQSFRARIASVWMNEEWFNDTLRLRHNSNWVNSVLSPVARYFDKCIATTVRVLVTKNSFRPSRTT